MADYQKTSSVCYQNSQLFDGYLCGYLKTKIFNVPKNVFFHDFNQEFTQFPSKKLWPVNCQLAYWGMVRFGYLPALK